VPLFSKFRIFCERDFYDRFAVVTQRVLQAKVAVFDGRLRDGRLKLAPEISSTLDSVGI
jgi:hypothetical protein